MTNSIPPNRDEYEWMRQLAFESRSLEKRQCPYTHHRLTPWGNVRIPEGTLSCGICDCFGYSPEEVEAAVAAANAKGRL